MRWVVALGAALVGIGACTAFGSDSPAQPTSPEAGAGTPEAGALEAGSSTLPSDGGGVLADGGVVRTCPVANAIFCDDFDGEPVLSFDGGVLVDVEGASTGPVILAGKQGQGLAAVVPVDRASDPPTDASAEKIVIPGTRDLTVEADVLLDDPGAAYSSGAASVSILTVQFGDDGDNLAVAVVADSPFQEGIYVVDDNGDMPQLFPMPPRIVAPKQWVHLRLDVGLVDQGDGRTGFATVTWGSDTPIKAQLNGDTHLTRHFADDSLSTTVRFGAIRYQGNTIEAPVTVHLDNVVVTPLLP